MSRLLIAVSIVCLASSAGPALVRAQVPDSGDFVVLSHFDVNVRAGPGLDQVIVGRAQKGTLFPLAGETGDWYEIELFSGVPRYVSKSLAYHLTPDQIVPGHRLELPASEDSVRALISGTRAEERRAAREAEALLPRSLDAERHAALRRLLLDRNLLQLFENRGIQPAVYWLPEAEALRM
jgi:hypothetical protein